MVRDLKFSVIMSVYKNDSAEFFDRALSSVTDEQTVMPNEIVLVVDGPVGDDINSVIHKYSDKFGSLKVIRLEKNSGLGNALRIAVDNSSYELIARMDSDDVSLPNRFEEQLKMFEQNSALDIVGSDISEFIGDEANVVAKRTVPLADKEIKEYSKVRCPFNHVTVMYKKSSVVKVGNYLDLFWNEDYYLWIRMVEADMKMANTGTVSVNVRTGEDMYKRRGGVKYFKSELFLQKYMRKRKMIGCVTYFSNVAKRFIVQILMPNFIRGWVFRTFARKSK